jgi:hypothetical protein
MEPCRELPRWRSVSHGFLGQSILSRVLVSRNATEGVPYSAPNATEGVPYSAPNATEGVPYSAPNATPGGPDRCHR